MREREREWQGMGSNTVREGEAATTKEEKKTERKVITEAGTE